VHFTALYVYLLYCSLTVGRELAESQVNAALSNESNQQGQVINLMAWCGIRNNNYTADIATSGKVTELIKLTNELTEFETGHTPNR
jgi:hypothetical protein